MEADDRFIGGASCMCIAISVAEIVSAYPTSGGMYFTVKVNCHGRVHQVTGSISHQRDMLLLSAGSQAGSIFSDKPPPLHQLTLLAVLSLPYLQKLI